MDHFKQCVLHEKLALGGCEYYQALFFLQGDERTWQRSQNKNTFSSYFI